MESTQKGARKNSVIDIGASAISLLPSENATQRNEIEQEWFGFNLL